MQIHCRFQLLLSQPLRCFQVLQLSPCPSHQPLAGAGAGHQPVPTWACWHALGRPALCHVDHCFRLVSGSQPNSFHSSESAGALGHLQIVRGTLGECQGRRTYGQTQRIPSSERLSCSCTPAESCNACCTQSLFQKVRDLF